MGAYILKELESILLYQHICIHVVCCDVLHVYKGSDGIMDKVSASQPRDRGFEPHMGHDHYSSYDTSTG